MVTLTDDQATESAGSNPAIHLFQRAATLIVQRRVLDRLGKGASGQSQTNTLRSRAIPCHLRFYSAEIAEAPESRS